MVGPNYHKPAVQIPTAYHDLRESPQAQAQAASFADLPWWQVFQDPQLQDLIRTALKQNYDMQLATERINSERAQLAITRSSLFPQVQGNGNFAGGKESNFQTKYNFLTLTADAAFQLDLFGRLRRATEASRAELLATDEAQHTVTLTLVSDVASAYFALLQLDLELQIARDTVKTQQDSVELTSIRLKNGVATRPGRVASPASARHCKHPDPRPRKADRPGGRCDQHSSRQLSGKRAARQAAGAATAPSGSTTGHDVLPARATARYSRGRAKSYCRKRRDWRCQG